ncbi:MAG TPA: FixH family protein, partial [Gemmatimonadaceae bacterium]|nr:FixH family protein [Gemmatimonadaceae bacterium]
AVVVVSLGLAASACSKSEQAAPAPAATGTPAGAASTSSSAPEITFKSDPDPVKTGENTFEVMVMQDGKPVNDASVSAEFYMPPMPQMKMPEMRTKADLAPAGDGVYRGKGQVMMAGKWDVTVMAMRGGQELATKKLTVTAQ